MHTLFGKLARKPTVTAYCREVIRLELVPQQMDPLQTGLWRTKHVKIDDVLVQGGS